MKCDREYIGIGKGYRKVGVGVNTVWCVGGDRNDGVWKGKEEGYEDIKERREGGEEEEESLDKAQIGRRRARIRNLKRREVGEEEEEEKEEEHKGAQRKNKHQQTYLLLHG